jgi:hypothetical protein
MSPEERKTFSNDGGFRNWVGTRWSVWFFPISNWKN